MSIRDFLDNEALSYNLTETQHQVQQDYSEPNATPTRLAYRARLGCWILRILTGQGGMPRYCEPGHPRMGMVADLLDIPALADVGCDVHTVQQALAKAYTQVHTASTAEDPTPVVQDCAMRRNIHWLADGAGLGGVEREIFEFAAALRAFRPLRIAVSTWGELGIGDLAVAVSAILHYSLPCVTPALERNSRLLSCGLITLNAYGDMALERLIKVPRVLGQRIALHEGHPHLILSHLVTPLQVTTLESNLEPSMRPGMGLQDFQYLQDSTQLAWSWLAGALECAGTGSTGGSSSVQQAQHRGTHLLVSGAPGLGKTAWVRALLSAYGAVTPLNAMELVVLDDAGVALSGEDRLSHLRLALNMMRNTPGGVLVFDEADDVFRAGGDAGTFGGDPAAVSMANHRASLNRLIEDSRIPVIWIMNHPDILDPAVLRRFDTVIPFTPLPRSVRLAMLVQRLGHLADDAEISRWADIADLTPALIDRLAVVVQRAQQAGQPMNLQDCRHWLRSRLPGKHTSRLQRRMGHAGSSGSSGSVCGVASAGTEWDANAVQASEDLQAIASGIGRCGTARLLLYGAPGTGKTAYAHALAKWLDKPLLEKRASDLLSPWVGETEQRIHQAFDSALTDDAVLFIDEVDSLLASRNGAVRHWEVSQVNELLEQLNDFEGIVVLATNRLDALDEAVLRRMDAKIHFESLSPARLVVSLERLCQHLDIVCTDRHRQRIQQLKGLTPGDFACVQRRLAFAPLVQQDAKPSDPTPINPKPFDPTQALLELLQQELRLRNRGTQPMGFCWVQSEEAEPFVPTDVICL